MADKIKRKTPKNNASIALGRFFREKRLHLGVSQGEIAKKLGCTAQFIANWENGAAGTPYSQIEDLIKILKVSRDEIYQLLCDETKKYWRKVLWANEPRDIRR